jgi:hypothetical protein
MLPRDGCRSEAGGRVRSTSRPKRATDRGTARGGIEDFRRADRPIRVLAANDQDLAISKLCRRVSTALDVEVRLAEDLSERCREQCHSGDDDEGEARCDTVAREPGVRFRPGKIATESI